MYEGVLIASNHIQRSIEMDPEVEQSSRDQGLPTDLGGGAK